MGRVEKYINNRKFAMLSQRFLNYVGFFFLVVCFVCFINFIES